MRTKLPPLVVPRQAGLTFVAGLHFGRPGSASVSFAGNVQGDAWEGRGVDVFQPTLGQTWLREYPKPQYAFKMSMFNVSCNSH